jgi:hypothetical protein
MHQIDNTLTGFGLSSSDHSQRLNCNLLHLLKLSTAVHTAGDTEGLCSLDITLRVANKITENFTLKYLDHAHSRNEAR